MTIGFPKSGRILLMDDVMDEVVLLSRQLKNDGFSVEYASSVHSAIECLKSNTYDVAVLDVMMEPAIFAALRAIFAEGKQQQLLTSEVHEEQGFAVAKWLRKNKPEVGVIMLTGTFNEEDHALLGLEAGADDYVSKENLRLKEFSARVRTLVRRCQPFSSVKACTPDFDLYVKSQKIVSASGQIEYLTDAEFMALRHLIIEVDKVIPRQTLLETANLNKADQGNVRAIDTLIKNIREKFTRCGIDASIIRTLRGKGYMLDGCSKSKLVE